MVKSRDESQGPSESSDHSLHQTVWLLHRLVHQLRSRQSLGSQFDQVEESLAALRLAPTEFAIIRSRVLHARRLAASGDVSAACDELVMVADCLQAGGKT